jgi:deoxyribonuclease V
MKIRHIHSWDVSYEEARKLQESLRSKLVTAPPKKTPRFIAGADVSYEKHGDLFFAGVVVWDSENFSVVEERGFVAKVKFPYIPGLLSFREAPVLMEAFAKIKSAVDAVIVDGQGIAHPREFGLAAHVTYLLDVPGAGCAKTLLVGEHSDVGINRGSRADLLVNGKRLGVALRSKDKVKPVFVSPGHRMSVDAAADLVLKCSIKYRLPEPTRLAHHFVNKLRRDEI